MRTVMLIVLLALSGCSTLSVPVEVEHLSHITQHFGSHPLDKGFTGVGAGIRWRPTRDLTVTVKDTYTPEYVDGMHEVFSATVSYEIPLGR